MNKDKKNEMIVADTPEKIERFRLLTLRTALKLETLGMKRSRGSARAMVVKMLRLPPKTNAKTAYTAYLNYLAENGISK